MAEEKILAKEEFESYLNALGNKMVIIWFSAPWCAPCRRIKATCLDRINKIDELQSKNIDIYTINIDDHMGLFGWLKTKRMVPGIPTLLAYYGDVERDIWYIPDDSVSGADVKKVNEFFDRCLKKHRQYYNTNSSNNIIIDNNNNNDDIRPVTAPM